MSAPRSIRFDQATIDKLTRYAARHPGMTQSSAAALLVEEALRMDAHPGVVFREGPAGRRAGLTAGPDVWEVVRAIRDVRASEPEARGDEVLDIVCDVTSLDLGTVQVALTYYGEFPDEIDALLANADLGDEEEHRRSLAQERLLGSQASPA